jgi:hypothetical protein
MLISIVSNSSALPQPRQESGKAQSREEACERADIAARVLEKETDEEVEIWRRLAGRLVHMAKGARGRRFFEALAGDAQQKRL